VAPAAQLRATHSAGLPSRSPFPPAAHARTQDAAARQRGARCAAGRGVGDAAGAPPCGSGAGAGAGARAGAAGGCAGPGQGGGGQGRPQRAAAAVPGQVRAMASASLTRPWEDAWPEGAAGGCCGVGWE